MSRTRIVVEDPDPAYRSAMSELLGPLGYELDFCGGPDAEPYGCSLVERGQCSLVDRADVVLSSLDLAHSQNRSVIYALHRHGDGVPVVYVAPQDDLIAFADSLEGCRVCALPVDGGELAQVLSDAIKA